jgi:PAS domain S-box
VITDPKGIVQYVNPKFTETTGYTAEEVIGKTPGILKSGKHSKEFYDNLWKTIRSGKEWRGEFYNRKKNGELDWESAVISAIIDKRGNISFC